MASDLAGFRDYQSPFADREAPEWWEGAFDPLARGFLAQSDKHLLWSEACRSFVKTGDPTKLAEMLTYVTLDNPPDAQSVWMETETSGVDARRLVGWLAMGIFLSWLIVSLVISHVLT